MLRNYQSRTLESARTLVRQGKRSICVASPTGSGKSVIIRAMAASAIGKGGRVLILSHRKELVDQLAEHLRVAGLDRVSVVRADDERFDPDATAVVASIPTLLARDYYPLANIVIFDEAHHVQAATWRAIADRYQSSLRVGFTATPERGDGSPLGDVFESLIVAANYSELIAAGHLVPCEVITPPERHRGSVGARPWDAYQAHGDGRPAVIFCTTVLEALECTQRLDRCRVVHGTMSDAERTEAISAFNSGACNVLANALVLTEGWDSPRVEVCVLGRACTHAGTYLQTVGRVLRPAPGKRSALLIDLVGAFHEHGFPTADREYSLTGQAIRRAQAGESIWQCKACGLVTVSPPADRCCTRCGTALPPPKQPKLRPSELSHATWTCECGHEHRTIPVNCPMCGRLSSRGRRVAAETDDQRQAYLAKLQAEAAEKGYKTGWIWHRYRAKYGSAA